MRCASGLDLGLGDDVTGLDPASLIAAPATG
jgi:hypothetical protein